MTLLNGTCPEIWQFSAKLYPAVYCVQHAWICGHSLLFSHRLIHDHIINWLLTLALLVPLFITFGVAGLVKIMFSTLIK